MGGVSMLSLTLLACSLLSGDVEVEVDVARDRERFPPLAVAEDQVRFLSGRQEYLELQLALRPASAERWLEELAQTETALNAWMVLCRAEGGLLNTEAGQAEESLDRISRELYFTVLRGELGKQAYQEGRMPSYPPVPAR
jgi:hypothetical protein